jgi:hypothetical protein
MKTQIVHIEDYDSLPSLAEKITQSDTLRVVLVDQGLNRIVSDEIQVAQLLRKCILSGKQIGLVSTNALAVNLWQEKGLPVFSDIITAQQVAWKSSGGLASFQGEHFYKGGLPKLEKPKVSKSIPEPARIAIFSLAILAVVVLLVALFPSTKITLYLPRQDESFSLPIRINPAIKEMSLSGDIPAKVSEKELTTSQTLIVTGVQAVPDKQASGQVVIKNLTNQEVDIPTGTIVSTGGDSPVSFATITETKLAGKAGSMATLDVTAVLPGSTGNIPAGAITTVDNALGASISVENTEAFSGGTDKETVMPSSADQIKIYSQAIQAIQTDMQEQAQAESNGKGWVIPDSFKLVSVTNQDYFPPEGMPGSTLTLDLSARVQILVVQQDDLLNYLKLLAQSEPSSAQTVLDGSLQVVGIQSNGKPVQGMYPCILNAARVVVPNPDIHQIPYLIAGKGTKQIDPILQTHYQSIQTASIENSPPWWPWVAALPLRIQVEVR